MAICLLGALVLVRDNSGPSTTSTVETFSPAPSSLVSTARLGARLGLRRRGRELAGQPGHAAAAGRATATAPLWLATVDGGPPQPVVFFYGAEFAPYAAAERWPLILALSRFGTFSQLGLMQSSATTAFANLSTFTFWNVSYTSKYVILESVERYSSLNPTGARYLGLQTPDARQAAAIASYGVERRRPSPCSTWPTATSSTEPASRRASWPGSHRDQIAGDLTTPASPLTQAVVSAANEITAAICSVDGDKPDTVCESRGVLAADQVLKITPPH